MDVYPWLKLIHVLLAIVAVGVNISYVAWLIRVTREPEHTGHVLRGVRFLDDRVANPSYAALGVVGVLLVLTGGWEFTQFWVLTAIVLYISLAAITVLLYSPAQRRQIAAYDAGGVESADFVALSGRMRTLGILLGVIAVTIVFLMVVKPG